MADRDEQIAAMRLAVELVEAFQHRSTEDLVDACLRAVRDAEARGFWRGVCAERAIPLDEEADAIERGARHATDPDETLLREAERIAAEAADLRRWAGES